MYYNGVMGILDLVFLVVIAGVCGFIAAQLMGARRVNIILLIILGFVGALVGKLVCGYFHLPVIWQIWIGGNPFPIVWAVIGSVIVVGLYSLVQQH
jgi:uncharacterized membrane protein YeaQ/YmgE (transglycosylase-associated protein family)